MNNFLSLVLPRISQHMRQSWGWGRMEAFGRVSCGFDEGFHCNPFAVHGCSDALRAVESMMPALCASPTLFSGHDAEPQLQLEIRSRVQFHTTCDKLQLLPASAPVTLALPDHCHPPRCCGAPSAVHMERAASAEGNQQQEGSAWVATFLSFIILLTVAGNFLLILLIFTQRSLRNTSNYFLVSLFMSDLMVGLVVMPPAMLNELYGRWVLDDDFCSVWSSFDVMCCSASILNLCVISLDRYLLITSPLKYKLRMTSSRALILVCTTWTLAGLASFLPIEMGWHEMDFESQAFNSTAEVEVPGAQCRLLVSLPYALIVSCLTFFLPSVAICFTYCQILTAARRQAVQVATLTSNVATTSDDPAQVGGARNPSAGGSDGRKFTTTHSKRALKASLTLGILLGMFFVAWLPFFVANVTQAICDCIPASLFDVLTWLGYCNSTMNPIIYPLFMRDFKRAMAKYLPYYRRWSERRPSVVSFTARNSNSGPRLGLTLRNMLALQPETDSAESAVQPNDHTLPPGLQEERAEGRFKDTTGVDSLHLFDLEQTDQELHANQLNTPMD